MKFIAYISKCTKNGLKIAKKNALKYKIKSLKRISSGKNNALNKQNEK